MLSYVLKRLLMIAVGFVAVIMISFYMLEAAPGNFVELSQIMAEQRAGYKSGTQITQEDPRVKLWEQRYGPQTPTWLKAIQFAGNAARLNLGPSFRYPDTQIEATISRALPATLELVVLSMTLALVIGIPLGIIAALYRNSWVDRLMMFVSMLGNVIPSYVLAVLGILLFSVEWRLLPTSGWGKPANAVLPVVALALGPIAGFARYMRNALIGILREDYIRTGYAKGGTIRLVILRHALRNSLIPLITVAGPTFAFLMVGSVWIETMFNIPGLGQLFALAAPTRDYPLTIAAAGFFALLIMTINLLVDIAYALLDPRIRASYAEGK